MKINLEPAPDRSQAGVQALIEAELQRFEDSTRARALRNFLIPPEKVMLGWEWANPIREFPVWIIARGRHYSTYTLLFSDYGFGPQNPWGLGKTPENFFGQDFCWYGGLETAYLESFLSEEPCDGHRPPLH